MCIVGPVEEEKSFFFFSFQAGPYIIHWTHKYFIKKKFKTTSHSIIHTLKNYFATAFSIFNFQQNKRYPNTP